MRLHHLFRAAGLPALEGSDPDITGITSDSRQVQPGMLFVAIPGFTRDGHDFVPEAVTRGAAAVVVQRNMSVPGGIPLILTSNSREALGRLSSAFFSHPSRKLSVIGITGTKGKGTTAHLIEAALSRSGLPCGIIGTLGAKIGDRTLELERTTPEASDLQRLLNEMVRGRMRYVAVEVASHALALHRVAGMQFEAAVFTNLTLDHLDFHKTFDEYRAAKSRLFEMVEPRGVSVINADDPSGSAMASASRARVVTYGITAAAAVRASNVRLHSGGAGFHVETPQGPADVQLRLHGRFNVYNALAAIAIAQWAGVALEKVVSALETFPGVPGRFEAVDEGQPFAVVVDYAHTPDSLENVLRTARDFTKDRLIVVFGCGGDRDKTKRPIMGRIAAELADVVFITSDNPRSEDPQEILLDIVVGTFDLTPVGNDVEAFRRNSSLRKTLAGMSDQEVSRLIFPVLHGGSDKVFVTASRAKAIREAITMGQPGDVVIIAGKGHEPYQEIKGVKHPFDDRAIAREALRMLDVTRSSPSSS